MNRLKLASLALGIVLASINSFSQEFDDDQALSDFGKPEPILSFDRLPEQTFSVEEFLHKALQNSESLKINKLDRLITHEETSQSFHQNYLPNLTFDVIGSVNKSVVDLNRKYEVSQEKRRGGRPGFEASIGTSEWNILSFGKQSLYYKLSKVTDQNSSLLLQFQSLALKNEILRKINRYQNLQKQVKTLTTVHDVLKSMIKLAGIKENDIAKQPVDSEIDLASNFINSKASLKSIQEELDNALIDLQQLVSISDKKFNFRNSLHSRVFTFSDREIERYVETNSFEVAMAKESLKGKGYEVEIANLKRLPLPTVTLSPIRFGAFSDNQTDYNSSGTGLYSNYNYSRTSFADLGIQVNFSVNLFGTTEFEKHYKVAKIQEARERQVFRGTIKDVTHRARRRVKRALNLEERRELVETLMKRSLKRLEKLSLRFIGNTNVYSGLDVKEAIAETAEYANSLSNLEVALFEEMTYLQEDLGFELKLPEIIR